MTFGEIEQKVRTLVNDTESEAYRFSQEVVFDQIVTAVRYLRNLNPAEKYGADSHLDEAIPAPSYETPVRIDPRHEEAVVKYAAHLIYELDQTDTVNMQISENLKNRAETLMQL